MPARVPPGAVTPTWQATLDAIVAYMLTNRVPPTVRELADVRGLSSATVSYHVHRLAEAGRLRIHPFQARGIRLLDLPVRSEVSR